MTPARSTLTRPHRRDTFHRRYRAAQQQPERIRPKQDALLMLAAVGVVAFGYVMLHLAAAVWG